MNSATEEVAMRDRLLEALRALGKCCYPEQEPLWPSQEQLSELDFAVVGLAKMNRKRPITALTPLWKAYECVDKLPPKIRLLPRVKDLVQRASERLKEGAESELARLPRKATSTGTPKLQRLVDYLEAIEKDVSRASKIEWEDYETLLGGDKPFRLAYGDSAPRHVRCYVRALELIVDDLSYRALRSQTLTLIVWIAAIGSPYIEMLKDDYRARFCADHMAMRRTDEIQKRKREQSRVRKRRQRRKQLEAFLRAEGISESEVQKTLTANA